MALFGIAKGAPARNTTQQLPPRSQVMLWVLDGAADVAAACSEGARFVVTNKPLAMQQQSVGIAHQCRAAGRQGG